MRQESISSDIIFREFKVDATQCDLQIGDRVTHDTVIGKDFETDETVTAGCRGRVVAVNFNAGDHALMILIQEDEKWKQLLGQLTGIVIAILIFLAACKVGLDVFKGADIQPTHFGVAIAGTLACIAVLHLLAQYKIRVGKEENFRLVIDDGHHSRADFLSSVVFLGGILG